MILAVVSRELGWGVEWSIALMEKVNAFRNGQKYVDKDAAVIVHVVAEKKDLTSSPFIIEFEHGAHNKGYWRYDHMVM